MLLTYPLHLQLPSSFIVRLAALDLRIQILSRECRCSESNPHQFPAHRYPERSFGDRAVESGLSAVEELKLLKDQVQDVARVCNAVANGDLSQKITVEVRGAVMVSLKDAINTMVRALSHYLLSIILYLYLG